MSESIFRAQVILYFCIISFTCISIYILRTVECHKLPPTTTRESMNHFHNYSGYFEVKRDHYISVRVCVQNRHTFTLTLLQIIHYYYYWCVEE